MIHFIRILAPRLHSHFRSVGVTPGMLFSRWLLTFYTNYFPMQTLLYVWDSIIIQGWKAIYKISIALLRELEPILITMELDEIA
mmetsp:Transcript_9912/g.1468  ORF Transcript_9912/g.1468 Transcript_9912/m.1468 type:complete len:84 (+) Transcript_9912:577-828(+)